MMRGNYVYSQILNCLTAQSETRDIEASQANVGEVAKADAPNPTLPIETLELLGEVKKEEKGPEIHEALTTRWTEILKSGLDKEIKAGLMKKYLTPKNCDFLKAPATNPEISNIMLKFNITKDGFKQERQQQLSTGITAVGETLTAVLNTNDDQPFADVRALIIEKLGDAGRILTDLFHELSLRRRASILPGLNSTAKKVAESSDIDNLLFGTDYSERLTIARNVEKEGKNIMKVHQVTSGSFPC